MTILGQMLEKKGVEKGIAVLIEECLERKEAELLILDKLQKYFSISRNEAKEYFDKYAVK